MSNTFKSILRSITPPILLSIKKYLFNNSYRNVPFLKPNDFITWWNEYKNQNELPDDLVQIVDYYAQADHFNKCSEFWIWLSKQHIEILCEDKIENFKYTLERKYYWGEATLESRLLKPIINDEITLSIDVKELFKRHTFCDVSESVQYNIANVVLLNYLVNNGYQSYIDKLEENDFGNPIYFNYKDKKLSFATLNSILEVSAIDNCVDLSNTNRILEVGAGSGRTCLSMFKLKNDLTYIIVDIAPTLYVSQSHISANMKDKKIFKFKPFDDFETVKDEFNKSDIAFISPQQLHLLPDQSVDLCIAIDCLHEMAKADVETYFKEFNRISSYLYFKCQTEQWAHVNPDVYTTNNYPTMDHWEKIMHEKCYIPNDYFHAVYQLK